MLDITSCKAGGKMATLPTIVHDICRHTFALKANWSGLTELRVGRNTELNQGQGLFTGWASP